MSDGKKNLIIVIPVFNDWKALELTLKEIDSSLNKDLSASILVVNDGSDEPENLNLTKDHEFKTIEKINILNLARNVGHQRAVAISLAYIQHNFTSDYVIVMDSDGEDKPSDIKKLIDASVENPNHVTFATRAQRFDSVVFKFFYWNYKLLFSLLTGMNISFGNFSLIPFSMLKRITFVSELWNHYAAGILHSKIPVQTVPTIRGIRNCGKSKMSLTALIVHGLSAISVYIDTVAVRAISTFIIVFVLSFLGLILGLGLHLMVGLILPEWIPVVVSGYIIIMIQILTILVLCVFLVLSDRTSKSFIPYHSYSDYVLELKKVM